MRTLALDVGKRRIGVAVSDPLGVTARPHSTLQRERGVYDRIAALAREMEVGCLVIGLPVHLDGREGEQAKDVRKFADRLREALGSVEMVFWDERLSTVEAEQRLADRYGDWRKRKARVDSFAAAGILQEYLNSR